MTLICVVAIMATAGMVDLLYVQKQKRQQNGVQSRHIRDGRPYSTRIGYIPTNTNSPYGPPGLNAGADDTERDTELPRVHKQPAGEYNHQFRDDDDEIVAYSVEGSQGGGAGGVERQHSHPFGRPL